MWTSLNCYSARDHLWSSLKRFLLLLFPVQVKIEAVLRNSTRLQVILIFQGDEGLCRFTHIVTMTGSLVPFLEGRKYAKPTSVHVYVVNKRFQAFHHSRSLDVSIILVQHAWRSPVYSCFCLRQQCETCFFYANVCECQSNAGKLASQEFRFQVVYVNPCQQVEIYMK